MNITLLDTLAAIMGVAMSLAYYPQLWKIYKRKSAANISRISYSAFAVGTTTWLLYGIAHHDYVVIAGFVFGVIGSWGVLISTYIYPENIQKENKKHAQ
ncbi:MAG: SemiSWEET family transporter [Patescibacteria group bacterium]